MPEGTARTNISGLDHLADAMAKLRPDWCRSAACRGKTAVMFPIQPRVNNGTREEHRARYVQLFDDAKALCASCPVQPECLDYTMDWEGSKTAAERSGVAGGKTPTERFRQWANETGAKKRTKTPRAPVMQVCPCPRHEVFDANRSVAGKYVWPPKTFASRSCRSQMNSENGAKTAGKPRPNRAKKTGEDAAASSG